MKRILFLLCVVIMMSAIFGMSAPAERPTSSPPASGGCSRRTMTETPNAVQNVKNLTFAGEWVISNWQERGTLTLKHDGEIVTITERNGIYDIASPDWVFNETRFRLVRSNVLMGESVQTYDGLKEIFSTTPDEVLQQAAASRSAVYRGTLSMTRDGRIVAERSNGRIVYDAQGRFRSFEQYPGWIRFSLTKKGDSMPK